MRQQKEQYAALARQINQYPPREETQAEIQALSAELVPPACPLKDVPPFPPASPAPGHFGVLLIKIHLLAFVVVAIKWIIRPKTKKNLFS